MTHSEQLNELAAALAEARKSFGKFGKAHTATVTSQKGGYQYKYGDLADLFDATTPALSAQGLTLSQWPDVDADGRFVLVTWLLHKSGQWMRGHYPLNTYERPQEQGSAITYAKRYAAGGVLGISAEVDDDGEAAERSTPVPAAARQPKLPTPPSPGYDNWLLDLEATADEGLEAVLKAWANSPPAYRAAIDDDKWAKIKVKASKAKATA